MSDRIAIDGSSLTCAQVAAVGAAAGGRGGRRAAAVAAARAAWQVAQEVAARQPVYGRNTGVGANHAVDLGAADLAEHGIRLLRSHAAGTGPLLAPEVARAMLVVRLNQLGAGGSGVDPALLPVLADAINRGFTPPVPLYGAIGTGDLTALASTGLCLLGERAWQGGTGPPPRFAHPHQRGARVHQQQRGDPGRRRAGLPRPGGPAAGRRPGGGAVAARRARLGRAVRRGGAPGPAAPGPAAGGGEHAGAARGATPSPRRGCRTRTDTGRSRRSTGPRWTRSSTRPTSAAELNGRREPADRRRPGHAVWHNGNFHAAYVGPGPGRGPRGAVPDRGAVGGPARHADGAGLHRPERVPRRGPGQLGHDDPGVRGAVRGGRHPPLRRARPRWAARCCPAGWRSTRASPPSRPGPPATPSPPTGPCWPAS